MFSEICEQYSGFSFSEKNKPEGKVFLLSDTLLTQGNFLISGIINFYIQDGEDGMVFLGFLNNFSHYQTVSKKMGSNIELAVRNELMTYIDCVHSLFEWIPADIPYTETTTNAWTPLPKNTMSFTLNEQNEKESLSNLIKTIEKALKNKKGRRAIMIDNLNVLEGIIRDKGALMSFLQSLLQIVKEENVSLFVLMTKDDENDGMRKIFSLLEMVSDYDLEIAENTGGYSKDISGQLVVSNKKEAVQPQKYLLYSKEGGVKIQSLKANLVPAPYMKTSIHFHETSSSFKKNLFESHHFNLNNKETTVTHPKMSHFDQNLKHTLKPRIGNKRESFEGLRMIDRKSHDHVSSLRNLEEKIKFLLIYWFKGLSTTYLNQVSRGSLLFSFAKQISFADIENMRETLIKILHLISASSLHSRFSPQALDMTKFHNFVHEADGLLEEYFKKRPELFLDNQNLEFQTEHESILSKLKVAACALKKTLEEAFEDVYRDYETYEESKTHKTFFKGLHIIEVITEEILLLFRNNEGAELEAKLIRYNVFEILEEGNLRRSQNKFYSRAHDSTIPFAKSLYSKESKTSSNDGYNFNERSIPYIEPANLRIYIAQAAVNVKKVTPYKISNIRQFLNLSPKKEEKVAGHSRSIYSFSNTYPQEGEIKVNDYFTKDGRKFLHYFQPLTQNLFLFDLEQVHNFADSLEISSSKRQKNHFERQFDKGNIIFRKIRLPVSFKISPAYASIVTPAGKLFISGCVLDEDNPWSLDSSFLKYKERESLMIPLPSMLERRGYHSMIYLQEYIYAVGGAIACQEFSNSCERYSLRTKKWERIASVLEGVRNPVLCTFNGKFIYKFGGLNKYSRPDASIERFDPGKNSWTFVNYNIRPDEEEKLKYGAIAHQINEKAVLILGGRNKDGLKTDSAYLFNPEEDAKDKLTVSNNHKLYGTIKQIDLEERWFLSYSGEIKEGSALIQNNSLYFMRKDYSDLFCSE